MIALVKAHETNTNLVLNSTTGILTYTNEDTNNPAIDLKSIEPWLGTDDNKGATSAGESIYRSGKVFINTNSPLNTYPNTKFVLKGNMSIETSSSSVIEFRNPLNQVLGYFGKGSSANDYMYINSTNGILFNVPGSGPLNDSSTLFVSSNGRVGIGNVLTPSTTLDINGNVRVSNLSGTDAATDLIVTADATTGILKSIPQPALSADLRVVGTGNHITNDAGVGSNGTSVGTGDNNIAIGTNVLASNTSGRLNLGIGLNSLSSNINGRFNLGLGFNSLNKNTSGNSNVAVGTNAMNKSVDGSDNTSLGASSLIDITTGERNVAIGTLAGDDLTSGNNNIFIGHQVKPKVSTTGSNQLNIGDWIFGDNGNIGIGVQVPSEKLEVAGNIKATGNIQTSTTTYPDYVFENYLGATATIDKTYTFKSLKEVESFIKANKHLPGVTGIKELEKTSKGYQVNLTKLSIQTLEKVEELYLHTIEQQKKIDTLKKENNILKARLSKIEALLGIK